MDTHSTCSTANQRKRGLARFSLRRLLYSSPLVARRVGRSTRHAKSSPPVDVESGRTTEGLQRATSKVSVFGAASKSGVAGIAECPLCLAELPVEFFPELSTCHHRSCYDCFQQYLKIEISESRVGVACPECSEPMHPNDIRMVLNDKAQYEKYEDFMVRRVLAVDPDTRWCPAPDCSFAVIATGCASCPKIRCERPGCDAFFCYHCKAEWHPNQTCDAARAQRSPNVRSSSVSFSQDSQHRDDIKPCPRCQVLIVKMDDGSCNHMTCAVCGAEFCWLCMKEISDLHYLSPSGCTFWGKKPWSRKKKILWQLGTLVGAPVGIGLVAGIAVPAMIIGIPVWVGRKLYTRYEHANKHKRNLAIAGGVTASVLVSPVLAGLAVGIGVPILLFYVYGVVPVSLCRSGGCGVSTSGAGVHFDFDDENDLLRAVTMAARSAGDAVSMDAVSHRGVNPSIGEASLSLGSGSQLERLGREIDRESVSNIALAGASLAGSIASSLQPGGQRLEVQVDVASTQRFSMSSETASAATSLSDKSVSASIADDGAASTRALAGSVLNFRPDSTDTCTPVEVHLDEACGLTDEGGLRRSRKRPPLDRQTSDSGSWTASGDDGGYERVRFDNHVSYITPHSYEADSEMGEGGHPRRGRTIDAKSLSYDAGSEAKCNSYKCGIDAKSLSYEAGSDTKCNSYKYGIDAKSHLYEAGSDAKCNAYKYGIDGKSFSYEAGSDAKCNSYKYCIDGKSNSSDSDSAEFKTSAVRQERFPSEEPGCSVHKTEPACDRVQGSSAAATLRSVFFHSSSLEGKRLPKLRESPGAACEGDLPSRTLSVIPEPSTSAVKVVERE